MKTSEQPIIQDGDHVIVWTPPARRNRDNMVNRLATIGNLFGFGSEEYTIAEQSFRRVMDTVDRFGGRIFAEDDLSLIIVSWMTIGIIWHPMYVDGNTRHELLGSWSSHS